MVKNNFIWNLHCYCKDDIAKIENYDLAVSDNFEGWVLHHRLETHTSDGILRKIFLSTEELVYLCMYFHRPAEELILMRRGEHLSLHNKGKTISKETRMKLSEKIKGTHFHTLESRKKISNGSKGKFWWTNDVINIRSKDRPGEDFYRGRKK